MSTTDTDLLLWLDLETTGNDVEKDCIIEIGCILTTPDLHTKSQWSCVVTPTPLGLGRLMQNPVVRQMHQANGLLDDVLTGRPPVAQHDATKALLAWLAHCEVQPGRLVLAGSGVGHFDRRFIAHYMPQLDRMLRYWVIDVGVIRRAHELWTGSPLAPPAGTKAHRAAADAHDHLVEARAFAAVWQRHHLRLPDVIVGNDAIPRPLFEAMAALGWDEHMMVAVMDAAASAAANR